LKEAWSVAQNKEIMSKADELEERAKILYGMIPNDLTYRRTFETNFEKEEKIYKD